MKTLYLYRHGKSDWDAEYVGDYNRPLAKRGRRAADQMGRFLKTTGQIPDLIISSGALRARTTIERSMAHGAWKPRQFTVTGDLYHADTEDLLNVIHQADDNFQSLMLVGHEPTWSEMTEACIGGGSVKFPTAAIARIRFDVSAWRNVRFGQGLLIGFFPPKLLPSMGDRQS